MIRQQGPVARLDNPYLQILFECRSRSRAIGHLPFLATLAAHPNPLLAKIEIVQIETHQFADAQTATVQQLEYQPVSFGEGPFQAIRSHSVDQFVGLLRGGYSRQTLWSFRRPNQARDVSRYGAVLCQKLKQRSHRGQLSANRDGTQTPLVEV